MSIGNQPQAISVYKTTDGEHHENLNFAKLHQCNLDIQAHCELTLEPYSTYGQIETSDVSVWLTQSAGSEVLVQLLQNRLKALSNLSQESMKIETEGDKS